MTKEDYESFLDETYEQLDDLVIELTRIDWSVTKARKLVTMLNCIVNNITEVTDVYELEQRK